MNRLRSVGFCLICLPTLLGWQGQASSTQGLGARIWVGHWLSGRNLYLGSPDIAVARDRLVFNLGEHTATSG